MTGRALPFLVLGAGVAVVSFAAILIRFAHAEGASSLAIAAMRLAIAALVLAPLAWWRHGREIRALDRRALLLCMLSGGLLALHFWTWITSLEYTSIASSTALVTTNPIWVGLASALLLRERPRAAAIAGIALTLAGSLLIFTADAQSQGGGRAPMLGNLLALLGAIAASGYLLVGRAVRGGLSLVAYVWLAYATAAVLLLLAVAVTGTSLGGLSAQAWGFLLLLAVGPQLIGHTAFNWALRRLSATFVAVSILGEPVGSAILAIALFGERFTALQFAGFALLLGGIFVAAAGERRPDR
ncbi:MAG TPA: DMT family transporter [Burkholderiales bacterium]|jgi:drug/metabolite transporter (DMT)-like permease|nr:DMT family transporter [Burkholderiales bacterium]